MNPIGKLTAAALLLTATAATAEVAPCYALKSPAGEISEMTITGSGAISVVEARYPQIVYSHFCPVLENEKSWCSGDCDGGNVHITHSAEGLRVQSSHYRMETMQFDSLLNLSFPMDADGAYSLKGDLLLEPADPSVCRAMEDRSPEVTFGPGDLHPRVQQLETYLLAGGHFLQGPDMIYDSATEEAVILYQRSVGLEPTGRADRALLRRIGVDAILAFGGC